MQNLAHNGACPLEQAANVTQSLCSLPAIATLNWCDDAASGFTPVRSDAVVAVTIGEIAPTGVVVHLDSTGAASKRVESHSLELIRRRFALNPSLGWAPGELPESKPAHVLLVDAEKGDRGWCDGSPPRSWSELGAARLLAGAARLSPEAPNRMVIVECGVAASAPAFSHEDASLLRATITPLAHKARLAFGEGASGTLRCLTPREQQVLDMLVMGMSVKQIASELKRSPHTVHDHVKSLHRKLNASSRGELIARALGHACAPSRTPRHRIDKALMFA